MLKMDDRSAEIDPSSNVSDGESDTAGRYLGYFKLHAPSWPAIFEAISIHSDTRLRSARSWITRLADDLCHKSTEKEYTQYLCELYTSQLSGFFYMYPVSSSCEVLLCRSRLLSATA